MGPARSVQTGSPRGHNARGGFGMVAVRPGYCWVTVGIRGTVPCGPSVEISTEGPQGTVPLIPTVTQQ